MNHVLVIDDDIELCGLITRFLEPEGFSVEAAYDGRSGVDKALTGDHDLVVLDVMLPAINGFEVLRKIRAHSNMPVLMLTARGDDIDRIVGLEIGADDYLPKPFNPRELIARIRAILRRTEYASSDEASARRRTRLSVGDVDLDGGSRVVRRSGIDISLTTVEFDLLRALLESAGHPLSREELTKIVLGREFSGIDRSIDTHISNLRRKLGPNAGGAERIKTVRSVGYQYSVDESNFTQDQSGH